MPLSIMVLYKTVQRTTYQPPEFVTILMARFAGSVVELIESCNCILLPVSRLYDRRLPASNLAR